MIRRFRRWIMKGARKLHTIDKHTNGLISTFIAAVVLALLFVSVFITNELSQKKIQNISQAQTVYSPDEAACNASCQSQSLNGVPFSGGSCLGLCQVTGEFTNTQFTCLMTATGQQGSCCCSLPAPTATPATNTCNADCVTAQYTSGSCQPSSVVTGGGLCSTGGTAISSSGCSAIEACCCQFTGATATPTITPIPSVTLTCTETDGGINYNQQGSMYYCNSVGSCQTTTDICFSTTILNENYCDASKNGVLQQYTCPNGCSNGACINSLTPTTTVTATLTPIATPATACGQNCYQSGAGDNGYCSNTANTCPNGGTLSSTFSCMANRSACCCIYNSPTPTATTGPAATATTVPPAATATTAPPTATPAACQSNFCPYGYYCVNSLCVTGTPTPTFTPLPTRAATPTCFNPKPPIWSPGVSRSGDTITVAWSNQMDGLNSKVEVCTNGGGTCQVIFDGTSPASNSVQKTITGISTKDIIVQMTSTNTLCGTTSDLASQYLAANAKVGVNVAPTITYSNGTPAWLIAGAAFIVVLLITVAIVAM